MDLLASALLVLGAGGHEARLERIAADPRRSRSERWTALSLVYSSSPERANSVLVGLQPTDGLHLTLQPAAEAVSDVLTDPAHGDTIAEALEALPLEMRPEAFAYLEELRRRAGSPAVLVYRELLGREGVEELRDLILETVVDEGGAEAAAELGRAPRRGRRSRIAEGLPARAAPAGHPRHRGAGGGPRAEGAGPPGDL